MVEDPLHGMCWLEAESSSVHLLKPMMLCLVTWTPERSLRMIGSAFINQIQDGVASVLTAAHNIEAMRNVQVPRTRHHPSSLSEFLGRRRLNVAWAASRALFIYGAYTTFCEIRTAIWNNRLDVAQLSVVLPESIMGVVKALAVEPVDFRVGDAVGLAGLADMDVEELVRERSGHQELIARSRFALRMGTVTAVHSDGHILSRSSCIETSIPVMPGMSGGPIFRIPKPGETLRAAGVISSDPEGKAKENFAVPGNSVGSLFRVTRPVEAVGDELDIYLGNCEIAAVDEVSLTWPEALRSML